MCIPKRREDNVAVIILINQKEQVPYYRTHRLLSTGGKICYLQLLCLKTTLINFKLKDGRQRSLKLLKNHFR